MMSHHVAAENAEQIIFILSTHSSTGKEKLRKWSVRTLLNWLQPCPRCIHEGMDDQALETTLWRDDQWLGFHPLNQFTVLDYFSLSPFYDRSCNNEVAKARNVPIR